MSDPLPQLTLGSRDASMVRDKEPNHKIDYVALVLGIPNLNRYQNDIIGAKVFGNSVFFLLVELQQEGSPINGVSRTKRYGHAKWGITNRMILPRDKASSFVSIKLWFG